jgi:hypothetical protein
LNEAYAPEPRAIDTPTIFAPLLLVDRAPWYDDEPDLEHRLRAELGELYGCIFGLRDVQRYAQDLIERAIPPGSLVLVPLMAGAMFYEVLRPYAERHGCAIVPLPMSRHPYVTLSADPSDVLAATLVRYCASAATVLESLPALLAGAVRRGVPVVYLDVNSTTGRDALLVEELLRSWSTPSAGLSFAVLIDESSEDNAVATGWRSAAKVRIADHRAVRLVGRNTKYLSHLAFLQRPREAQFAHGEACRARFPNLLAFWDRVPPALQSIHAYGTSSEEIVRRRLHLRYSRDESERDLPREVERLWRERAVDALLRPRRLSASRRLAKVERFLPFGAPLPQAVSE